MLQLETLRNATLRTDPYPYTLVTDFIESTQLSAVLKDFPEIDSPGSIPIEAVSGGPAYQALMEALEGDEFRQAVASKFGLSLDDFPTMTTLRGVMREKDGRIHTDSKTKVITVLVYLNETWDQPGGCLRVLRNGSNINDYVEEIAPLAGTMMIFRVTDNCWHGHTPVEGKRQSIQMNYLIGDGAKNKHQFFHRLSAWIKKLLNRPGRTTT
ncbi:MAG: 2OG-Fe(II) oxygenase [Porticoccaceae bacterium]|nr:2OG-Fe(II) oxygenase [Porticoccaceae bacterium]